MLYKNLLNLYGVHSVLYMYVQHCIASMINYSCTEDSENAHTPSTTLHHALAKQKYFLVMSKLAMFYRTLIDPWI